MRQPGTIMRRRAASLVATLCLSLLLGLCGSSCSDSSNGGDADTDADTDTDSDSDIDIDIDTDTDVDTDSDTDVDSDTDTDVDTDSDTDVDSDTDTDVDTDSDTDADTDTDTDPACAMPGFALPSEPGDGQFTSLDEAEQWSVEKQLGLVEDLVVLLANHGTNAWFMQQEVCDPISMPVCNPDGDYCAIWSGDETRCGPVTNPFYNYDAALRATELPVTCTRDSQTYAMTAMDLNAEYLFWETQQFITFTGTNAGSVEIDGGRTWTATWNRVSLKVSSFTEKYIMDLSISLDGGDAPRQVNVHALAEVVDPDIGLSSLVGFISEGGIEVGTLAGTLLHAEFTWFVDRPSQGKPGDLCSQNRPCDPGIECVNYSAFTGVCRTACTNVGSTGPPCTAGETCKVEISQQGEEQEEKTVCIGEGTVEKGENCNNGTLRCKPEFGCGPLCMDQENPDCQQMICQTRCPNGDECAPTEQCVELTIGDVTEKICLTQ